MTWIPLTLLRILGLERTDALAALLRGDVLVPFDAFDRLGQIRDDEGFGVAR